MYVCLCKGLTETQVAEIARDCRDAGNARPCAFLRNLDLNSEDACGHCAEDPAIFLTIAADEWHDSALAEAN